MHAPRDTSEGSLLITRRSLDIFGRERRRERERERERAGGDRRADNSRRLVNKRGEFYRARNFLTDRYILLYLAYTSRQRCQDIVSGSRLDGAPSSWSRRVNWFAAIGARVRDVRYANRTNSVALSQSKMAGRSFLEKREKITGTESTAPRECRPVRDPVVDRLRTMRPAKGR